MFRSISEYLMNVFIDSNGVVKRNGVNTLKMIPRTRLIYSFSPRNEPVETAKPGELVLFETIDALGGQIKSEDMTLNELDWSKVDGATGPLYVEGAEVGDTLVVDILDIRVEEIGVMVVIPKYGALSHVDFKPRVKLVRIKDGLVHFDGIKLCAHPMIGTIGVAPGEGEVPAGSLGKHGGNMDTKEVRAGTRLYFPVFAEGALLAMGDLHALQANGELCVSAVEVSGEVLVKVDIIKGKQPPWPILETDDHLAVLACGDTLDEACTYASETAVKGIAGARGLSFEEAYMLASLTVDLEINQVVDPKKGVRAVIPKELIGNVEHLFIG